MKTPYPPIIVISGAIGGGKGTIVHALHHELELEWVPTHTTRPMRHDDTVLSRRIFDTDATFQRHIDRGEFLEFVEIAAYRYGTLKADLEQKLKEGKPLVMEISVDGGRKIAELYPESLLIFITADAQTRHKRIQHRGMEKDDVADRMKESDREEKLAHQHYDYIIENVENHPEAAIDAIKEIISTTYPHIFPRVTA